MRSTIGERLLWRDGDFTLSQCAFCAHKDSSSATCKAFPEGIPLPILRNQMDHRKGHIGDHRIRFRLAADEEAPYLAATRFNAIS